MWKWGKGKRRVKRMYIRFTQSTTYIMCSRRGFLKHSENLSSSRFGASNAQLLIRACRRFSLASDLLRFIRSVVLPSLTSRVVRFALKTILRFPLLRLLFSSSPFISLSRVLSCFLRGRGRLTTSETKNAVLRRNGNLGFQRVPIAGSSRLIWPRNSTVKY